MAKVITRALDAGNVFITVEEVYNPRDRQLQISTE